ncbi:uncharacterized protein LOC134197824 [Corticium candelabrum]|uniref:uncharacterized protein LOC134197824 n=1 Tax=Corticium candelabrum TaxID=121492 RepID=UPI002E256179|nr:uncharacterized protein LOC134197824 [Corticium candelabrum]
MATSSSASAETVNPTAVVIREGRIEDQGPETVHTEIVANDYMHEISTGAMPETGHSAITHLAGTPSAICVTDNEGQVFEAQTGSDVTTVQLVHDAAQAIPQQVVETTTTELSAAAAILSVAGAHAFQQGAVEGSDQLQVIQHLDVGATSVLTSVSGDQQTATVHIPTADGQTAVQLSGTGTIPSNYTIARSADGRIIVSADGSNGTEILMLNQGQGGHTLQVVPASSVGDGNMQTSQFALTLSPATPMSPTKPVQSGSKLPAASDVVKGERQKQQKRLLRKLQACAQEYCLRLGEECVIVASVRVDSLQGTPETSNAVQREVQVFGSKLFEEVIRSHITELKNMLDEQTQQSPSAAFESSLPSTQGMPVLPLPARDLDSMNGNELKSYVPLLLRHCMGRNRPMWGMEEHRPSWWPDGIPFENVRMDTRPAGQVRETQTWSACLRQIVRACFQHFGCEALLDGLPKVSHSAAQRSMLVFSSPAAGMTPMSDQSHSLDQSLSAAAGDESMQQEPQPAAQELESGAVAVQEHETMVAEQTVTTVQETPRSTRKRRRASGLTPEGPTSDAKKTAGAVFLRVHYRTNGDMDGLEEVMIHPSLTCADVLKHMNADEQSFELRTAYDGGAGLTGNVTSLVRGQSLMDVYLVKRAQKQFA